MDTASFDYFTPLKRIKLFKLDRDDAASRRLNQPECGRLIRLYKSFSQTWSLQLFGPLSIGAKRHDGKDFIIATAELSRDELIALRDAINTHLKES